MTGIYLELTRAFNDGRLRAILSSGQAVVWHRLAIMSKDGDWIIRDDDETLSHLRSELARRGAVYRCGAPLDARWLIHGWSSHLEFSQDGLRIRTDFVSRPARLDALGLDQIWRQSEDMDLPVLGIPELIVVKQTNREKDYAVIGELARRLEDPALILRLSRSVRDLQTCAAQHPDLMQSAIADRPCLSALAQGEEALAAALDAERRQMIRRNESRLERYLIAAQHWRRSWLATERRLAGLPLSEAHPRLVAAAERLLPQAVAGGWP